MSLHTSGGPKVCVQLCTDAYRCVQLCTVVYRLYTTVHNCTQLSEVREAGFNEYGSAFDFYIPAVHPSCRNIHEQPCAS